jgi:hypothetical protein
VFAAETKIKTKSAPFITASIENAGEKEKHCVLDGLWPLRHFFVMRVKRLSIFLCAALFATALVTSAQQTPPPAPAACGPFPKLYKEIVWNWMQANLVDANTAKIEWEGEPICTDRGKNGEHLYGWLVNFKVNARNRLGFYTGFQKHAALIRDGQVIKGIGFGY